MKKDNVMPDNFFDKETLKAFLTGCENQNRFNVSVISSICLELSEADNTENDSGFRNDCANRILKQCSQIMKMADIYRIISDTLSENSLITEYVEFSSYLEYFTEQCSELLGNSCKIILNHGEKKETDIIKKLLDFSYDYCNKNGFDFLFLVPAEESLFRYYETCGFSKFGISRVHTVNDTIPPEKALLKCEQQIEFNNSVTEYWSKTCTIYGGEVTKFGLVFDDEETVIRNASGNYESIPEKYKKSGTIIKGNISFGTDYCPAMIKTENEKLKKINCYVGVTLE